ncbi:MAG: hypothetical protein RLY47_444 [Candidatus Parcubacteria bacterium]|jgi:CheY-like chemotaxis protein
MKILVFDDTKKHRDAAVGLLKDHEVVVVGTYDEAQAALLPNFDHQGHEAAVEARIGATPKYDSVTKEAWNEYWEKRKLVSKELKESFTTYHNFDAVLTDLLVPASKQAQGPGGAHLVGQEMPLGSIIALLAISNGVKKVAVVTDANHHNHPASAAFDCFESNEDETPVGGAGDVRVLCTNRSGCTVDELTYEVLSYEYLQTPEGKEKYPQLADYSREGTLHVKDWRSALERLCG